MRLLTVLLMFLCALLPSELSAGSPSNPQEMLHLTVKATGVRLRAGAGAEFAIVGMASRNNAAACRFIAQAEPRMDSMGKLWFRLLGNVQQQEDLAVFKFDKPCWIRSDFIETRALSSREAEQVDSVFFRVLRFAPKLLTAVRPVAALPAYSDEKLCFFPQGQDEADRQLPAGEEYLLLNLLKGQRHCVGLWKAVDAEHIRFAGAVPVEVFAGTDLGDDRKKAETWLKQRLNP